MSLKLLLLITICAGVAVLDICHEAGIRLNTTASLPVGLYIRTAHSDYVTFCLDDEVGRMALAREYITAGRCSYGGTPVLKEVVARAGDTVHLGAEGITVNGKLLPKTVPRERDSAGRPMTIYPFGTYHVAPGTLWADSTYDARSFGSRYIGPVREDRMLMYVKPLLTF